MIIILHYKLKISNGMSLIFNVFLMKHKCLSDMLPTLSLNTAVAENFINIVVHLLKYIPAVTGAIFILYYRITRIISSARVDYFKISQRK